MQLKNHLNLGRKSHGKGVNLMRIPAFIGGYISIRLVILFTVSVLISTQIFGQESYGNNDVWFMLLTTHRFNEPWGVGNELHMRYDDGLKDKGQFLLRPFVDYHRNENVIFTLGYTYLVTYPYGEYALPSKKPEHHLFEQVTLTQNIGKLEIAHRYRLEQRFQSTYDKSSNAFDFQEVTFANRFRYRIMLKYDINDKYFINVFDEIWIKSNENMMNSSFDRNWFYAGIGRHFNKHVALQIAFLHQNIRRTANLYERHPTLQFVLVTSF